ncbi:MAG: alpha/beta fold hydrolase [bacterium]
MRSFRKTSFSVYLPDETRCRGAYYPGDNAAVGIHVHGFRSSAEHGKSRFFLDHALRRGHSWANFDLPCHGRSEGAFKAFRLSAALAALIGVIRQFRGAPVLLLGSSLGAWLAMLAARKLASASDIRIVAAVLIAPAFDFFDHYFSAEPQRMREWQRDGVLRFTDDYDGAPYELEYGVVADAARHNLLTRPVGSGRYNFPIRIFHGDRDQIAPIALSHRFKAISPGADIVVRVIAGGDHSLDAHLPLIAAEVDRQFAALQGAGARLPEAV